MKNFKDFIADTITTEAKFTEDDWQKYNEAAKKGTIKDDDNPIFVFSTIPTKMLKMLASGKYNVEDLIKLELSKRG